MKKKKNILAINGSASKNSTNLSIINQIIALSEKEFNWTVFNHLTMLPHFRTELTDENTPETVKEFRNLILNADGILISTPEYVFSIPSRLKNAIEWCVSTTVFSNKPIGLITASASGIKGHAELKLIMKTIETKFSQETTLLIQGAKGKINKKGKIMNIETKKNIENFTKSFIEIIRNCE